MKILQSVGLLLLLAVPGLAAEEGEDHGNLMVFRVINFVILAVGLWYLIKKNAGPYFASRNETISREISEAQKLVEQSEQRARAIDERLSRLDQEIEQLRSAARAEMAAEHARLEREAEQAVRKVFALAEREMAATTKAARLELKSHVASLAVGLAEKKIAGQITPQTQQALVGAFVRDLM